VKDTITGSVPNRAHRLFHGARGNHRLPIVLSAIGLANEEAATATVEALAKFGHPLRHRHRRRHRLRRIILVVRIFRGFRAFARTRVGTGFGKNRVLVFYARFRGCSGSNPSHSSRPSRDQSISTLQRPALNCLRAKCKGQFQLVVSALKTMGCAGPAQFDCPKRSRLMGGQFPAKTSCQTSQIQGVSTSIHSFRPICPFFNSFCSLIRQFFNSTVFAL
jgi:hypothetical protein